MPRRGDDFGPQPQIAFPRLTPAVKAMLIGVVALFVVQMIEQEWLQRGWFARFLLLHPKQIFQKFPELWRLVTWPVVEAPDPRALLFGCITLYFFATELEEDFGTRRFVLFMAISVLSIGVVAALYGLAHPVYFSKPVYGLEPIGYLLITMWGMRYPHRRLFFPPVSARVLVWVTLGMAILFILARAAQQSPAASLGAIGLGWAFARYWDRIDDWLDRRRLASLKKKRDGGGRLRVLPGGRGDDPKKRDKRFLN
ncbi:MAG: rhomboid family intramembrane serine protease [Deltaproteobacteria bacterium]|nr:rhomboid family intramembrane serine protease [Deltaproteobacteria bacterium]